MLLANFLTEHLSCAFCPMKVPCSIRTPGVFMLVGVWRTFLETWKKTQKSGYQGLLLQGAKLQKVTINTKHDHI